MHNTHFLASLCKDAVQTDRYRHSPLSQLFEIYRGRFYCNYLNTLATLRCSPVCLTVKKLTAPNHALDLSVFAAESFEKRQNICYYFGSLVYSDLNV